MKIRVLVVDDATDLREEMVDYLRFSGYDAHGVGSVAGLVECLESEPWQVVLLDLGLPDGDGLVAAHRLRRERGLTLGIIMVTARGQVEDRIAGARAGADAYLVKPVDLRELHAIIGHLVQRLALSAEPPAPAWRIDRAEQALIAPDGSAVPLTGAERIVLEKLLAEAGRPVARETLCEGLPPGGSPDETRRLDSLISRLRAKVATHTDLPLPIRAIRNIGYAFTGTTGDLS